MILLSSDGVVTVLISDIFHSHSTYTAHSSLHFNAECLDPFSHLESKWTTQTRIPLAIVVNRKRNLVNEIDENKNNLIFLLLISEYPGP